MSSPKEESMLPIILFSHFIPRTWSCINSQMLIKNPHFHFCGAHISTFFDVFLFYKRHPIKMAFNFPDKCIRSSALYLAWSASSANLLHNLCLPRLTDSGSIFPPAGWIQSQIHREFSYDRKVLTVLNPIVPVIYMHIFLHCAVVPG